MKNIIKIRAILSSLLLITFIIVLFTGIGLYFSPSGRIAREIGWTFLGFNKEKLENLHTLSGFIMSALVMIHLFVNYKMFLSEIKTLFKRWFGCYNAKGTLHSHSAIVPFCSPNTVYVVRSLHFALPYFAPFHYAKHRIYWNVIWNRWLRASKW